MNKFIETSDAVIMVKCVHFLHLSARYCRIAPILTQTSILFKFIYKNLRAATRGWSLGYGDNGTTNYTVTGATGGTESVTLTGEQIPKHTHEVTQEWYRRNNDFGTGSSRDAVTWYNAGQGTTKWTVTSASAFGNSSGGTNAHENRMPYIVVCMWQRTA
jgi:hypothetical protein